MACPGCQNCNGSPVKESLPLPVAIICDLSSGAANCPNPDVSVLNVCDSTGAPLLEVILSCNGVPQATPTYLNFDLTPATPSLPVTSCSSAFSVSTETACIRLVADDSIVDNVEIVKVIDTTTGSIATLRVFSLDGVTEYSLPLPATQRLGSCELSYQTFEINEVCADGAKAFRVEQKQPDGSSTIVFYGTNGAILTPVTWTPGSCAGNAPNSISMVQVCANGGTPAFRREVIDDADVSTVTFLGLNGAPFVPVSWFAGECPENLTDALDDQLVCADGLPAFRHETLDENGVSTVVFIGVDGTLVTPVTWTPGSCTDCVNYTETIVCAAGVQLIRRVDCQGTVTFVGSDGVTVPTPIAYTIGNCVATIATPESLSVEAVCADGNQAFRRETLDENGVSTVTFLSTDGTVIVPTTWEPGACNDCASFTESIVCASGVQLLKRTNNCTGVDTFIGSDGVVVPTPLTYTIGECVATSAVVPVAETTTLVCADGAPAIRKEVLYSDSTIAVIFLGTDGALITPTTWFPGECPECLNYSETIVCADGVQLIRRVDCENAVTFVGTDGVTVATPATYTIGDCNNKLIQACDTFTNTPLAPVCGVDPTSAWIANSIDTASEALNGAVTVNPSSARMANNIAFTEHSLGMRFQVDIPQGSQICSAFIQFTAQQNQEILPFSAVVSAEDVDNSAAFVNAGAGNYDIQNRAKTVTTIWNDNTDWGNGEAGVAQATPDLTTQVQQVINRPLWVSGNVMGLFVEPTTGMHRVRTQIGGTVPVLKITYFPSTGLQPVTVCVPFFMEVANDETPTGNNFFIDPADNTWKPYTIQGTVSTGSCKCDANDANTYQTICLQDSNNIQFVRVFAINALTSVASLVGDYLPDFTGSYTPVGAVASCNETTYDSEVVTFCDNNGAFLRHIIYDELGNVDIVYDTTVDGVTTYTPVGTVGTCSGDSFTETIVCAAGVQLIRRTASDGTLTFISSNGTVVAAPLVYTIGSCAVTDIESVQLCFTANTAGAGYAIGDQVIDIRWFNTATNTQVSEVAFNVTQGGSAVATPLTAANFDECATNSIDREFEVLCDSVGNFLRRYSVNSLGVVTVTDTTLDGVTPYVPVGTIGVCTTLDREFEVLCDTVGSFLRRYSVSSTGVVTTTDTTLDGTTAYVPVGAVGTCNPTVADREFEVLCDTVGTFLRRYSVSSTGVVTTTDTTLDGTTPYVVTGAVDICKYSQVNPEIDSTLVRQTGAGVVTILAGARSVTVTVLAGAPTVSIDGGAAVTLIAGLSMTWEIDLGGTAGEALQDSFAFTGNASSDFYVHTTREI